MLTFCKDSEKNNSILNIRHYKTTHLYLYFNGKLTEMVHLKYFFFSIKSSERTFNINVFFFIQAKRFCLQLSRDWHLWLMESFILKLLTGSEMTLLCTLTLLMMHSLMLAAENCYFKRFVVWPMEDICVLITLFTTLIMKCWYLYSSW